MDVAARAAGHRHMAAGDVDVLDIHPWLHPVDALLLQEQDCFGERLARQIPDGRVAALEPAGGMDRIGRSEEHTSELQSLMRISYAVVCLKKRTKKQIV